MSGQLIKPLCSFPGCHHPKKYKVLCSSHYAQKRKGRELRPLYEPRPRPKLPEITYTETECSTPSLNGPCHVFTGQDNGHGYKTVRVDTVKVYVHRYIWERDVGPIPEG